MIMSKECESYIREKVTTYLLEIGMAANLQGFKYIRDAVLYIVHDPRYKRGVTKRLYPTIAEKYEVSVSIVERAIRHAIDVCCARGNMLSLNRIFQYTVCDVDYKPTISEFISLISEKVKGDAREFEITRMLSSDNGEV